MFHAWETTIDDVKIVLTNMHRLILDAEKIHGKLDHASIEKAALRGNDMDDQTEGAYAEIERQIKVMRL